MRIDRIEIKNFRCFAETQIAFDPKLTVFVAHNGQGKSALLDAIKVVLWPYVAGFDLGSTTNDATGIQIDDVRRVRIRAHHMEWQGPSIIEAKGHIAVPSAMRQLKLTTETHLPWIESRIRTSVHKNAKTKTIRLSTQQTLEQCAKALQAQVFANSGLQDDLPILAYYGAERGKLPAATNGISGESYSRTFAYRNCLDPSVSYSHFANWFTLAFVAMRNAQLRNLERQVSPDTKLPEDLTAPINVVRQAVNQILEKRTGWKQLSYSAEHQQLVLEHDDHGELKVSQLSDGIRNMLAMVGDIAYRCYKLNAHYGDEAARKTAGIVMIDEVDLHLHPEWQQTVLADLQAAFPQIQFITTTHSPQVLSTVEARCIRQLESELDDVSGQAQTVVRNVNVQTQGIPSSAVLAEVMGVNPVPDVAAARQLERYHAMISQGRHESLEGQELRNQLDAHFGLQHPLILDCDRAIRFHAFKQKLPARTNGNA